jgi:crotonobetainyl-CoA:carnitine CoA-transferase CaiB-like acyl-CoA transferase
MVRALEGVRVLDFGHYIAGPLTGMMLADHGADVIKIDPPGGPAWVSPARATWNRGKRAIALDLKQPKDLEVAQRLIAEADVLIENFRPGVMDRLGLGPAATTAANPRLVYCSLPGFASDDPRAGVRAFEGVIGAATANYRGAGAEHGRPVYTAIPTASVYAAFQAAVAVAMALYARERDGLGQRVEVALYDAMFPCIGRRGIIRHDPAHRIKPYGTPWDGSFLCQDDRWLRFGSWNQDFGRFVEAAGITDWPSELVDLPTLMYRPDLHPEMLRRAGPLFRSRTAEDWEALIAGVDAEAVVVRSSAEWITHPHARESGMVVEVDDPTYGRMLQPGINARLSLTPGRVSAPAPLPDQQRGEILAELGPPAPPSRPVRHDGSSLRAALEGVKVLDLCIVLAGPTLGRTLAEYGADVIKIDPPRRRDVIAHHTDINRGKRHMMLDLKSEDGRAIFWRLLEDADVVAENFRVGKLAKLGLSYEEVRKRRPEVIYVSSNTYGYSGPFAHLPGHEQMAQAVTGMMDRYGGDGIPVSQPYAVNDYGTGYMAAYGVALALLHRSRTGEGQHVSTSLSHTAMTLQSAFVQGYEGKVWDEARGQNALGDGPLHRAHRAADGWIFLGGTASDLPRLAAVLSLEGLAEADCPADEALADAIAARIAGENAATWVARLTDAGIGAHVVLTDVHAVMQDPYAVAHGLSVTREFDEIGPVTACGPAPRLSRTPVALGAPPPKPGKHAREILEGIGWGDEFQRLVASGVIRVDGVTMGD